MIDPNGASILYQAKAKLLDLMYELAETRSRKVREKNLQQAAQIRYYVRALRFASYITDDEVNKIYQCLIDVASINEFPVNPNLPTVSVPDVSTVIIQVGTPGADGRDGGATDFSKLNQVADVTADEFADTSANAARWDYVIYGATGRRAGTVHAVWDSSVSTAPEYAEDSTTDFVGSTSAVTLQVVLVGDLIRLVASIASGTWSITGSRYFIPNQGAGVVTQSVLESGKIIVGNSTNIATAVTMSGDGTINNTGVFAIASGVIVNADVSASAAVAWSKLATGTADRVAVTSSGGVLTTSSITTTKLGYLSNVTSDIQAQIDALSSGTFNGAVSTVLTVNLTADRVVVSNPSGKIAASGVTTTNLNTLDTTTSLTTQLAGKLALTGGTITGSLAVNTGLTVSNSLDVVTGNLGVIAGNLTLNVGSATIGSHLNVAGNSVLAGTLQVNGNLGVYGTTPIAKITVSGSRGGNAALANLLTALSNYGLITNSTTA